MSYSLQALEKAPARWQVCPNQQAAYKISIFVLTLLTIFRIPGKSLSASAHDAVIDSWFVEHPQGKCRNTGLTDNMSLIVLQAILAQTCVKRHYPLKKFFDRVFL